MQTIARANCRYTACFCEENVWWLARDLVDLGVSIQSLSVVFFTNPTRSVLLLNQRAAPAGMPLIWDYHVVLRAFGSMGDQVFDLDSRLPFPARTGDYLGESFPKQSALAKDYRAWARSIPASSFLTRFQSDRSHMHGILDPSEFPEYPPISASSSANAIDLRKYWDVDGLLPDGSEAKPLSVMFPQLA